MEEADKDWMMIRMVGGSVFSQVFYFSFSFRLVD